MKISNLSPFVIYLDCHTYNIHQKVTLMHCHVQLLQKDMLFPYLDIQQNYYSAKNLHIIGGVSGKVKRAPNISVSITLILMLFLTYVVCTKLQQTAYACIRTYIL